jgi:hypothetical protein
MITTTTDKCFGLPEELEENITVGKKRGKFKGHYHHHPWDFLLHLDTQLRFRMHGILPPLTNTPTECCT